MTTETQPVAGQMYDPDYGWQPVDEPTPVEDAAAPPLGWVPVPGNAGTPIFDQLNHGHRWQRTLSASRADTAASTTHMLVTLAGGAS